MTKMSKMKFLHNKNTIQKDNMPHNVGHRKEYRMEQIEMCNTFL